MPVKIDGNGTFTGTSLTANNIVDGSLTTAEMAFSVPSSFGDLNSYGFSVRNNGNCYAYGDVQTLVKNFNSWSSSMVTVYKNNSNMFNSSDFTVTVPVSGTWQFNGNLYMQQDGSGGGLNGHGWAGLTLASIDGSYNYITDPLTGTNPAVFYNWNQYRTHGACSWTAVLTAGTKIAILTYLPNLNNVLYRISNIHWSGYFMGAP